MNALFFIRKRTEARRGGSTWLGVLLLAAFAGCAVGLALWKRGSFERQAEAAAAQPEPAEVVTATRARTLEHQRVTSAIGTVLALRSITLRNELPGRIVETCLEPGVIVEAGTTLVRLDVSVEEAEVRAQRARANLAETVLLRLERALESQGASALDVDRARAERDVALAEVARLEAVVARKAVVAPFRAQVGMTDVHAGQYLDAGTELTTLQGVDDGVHIDFSVAQSVAAVLEPGQRVGILAQGGSMERDARVVAIDARVDPQTRNAWVRALLEGPAPAPGAAVRVRVPLGPPTRVLAVSVGALRRGPAGDHVFVLESGADGALRAHARTVQSGSVLGDEVVIESGLTESDLVATSGSFKLREGAKVVLAETPVNAPR